MPEFINTADVIGDDELCDRIIMRTVTEYKENRITKVGSGTFSECKELLTVDIPEVVTIHNGAFSNCSKLISVNAPNASTIEQVAFQRCTALEKVCFPALAEVQGNPVNASYGPFSYCTALKYVDLPVCTNIYGYSFNNSTGLTTLILRNDTKVCTLQNIYAFAATPISTGTGYIYVPRALLEDYKVATNWATYAAQIRAIEDYPDICGG